MRARYTLTDSTPYIAVSLEWEPKAVYVENPTGSPIYLHVGGTSEPSQSNADHTIPAASIQLIAVIGRDFGVALADPTAAGNSQPVIGQSYRGATVSFLTADEQLPMFGSMGTNSLSQSDQLGGELAVSVAVGVPETYGPFDIGGWGGFLVYFRPDTTSARGYVRILSHQDSTNPVPPEVARYPIWPGAPILIIVPRTQRYIWVEVVTETYEATPVTGFISARMTLVEVLSTQFVPYALPSIMTFTAVPPIGGTFNTIMPTYGLASCEVVIQWTTFGAGQSIAYRIETSTDRLKWRYLKGGVRGVTDPNANITYSANRLEQYIRVTITNNSNPGSAHSGYIAFTAKTVADPSLDIPTQYWDRGGTNQTLAISVNNVGPHGATQRAIYTVPSSHQGFCELINGNVNRNTAATASGSARMEFLLNGSTFAVVSMRSMGAQTDQAPIIGQAGPLYAGDALSVQTSDSSTNGTVDYRGGVKLTDYSVAG